MSVIYVDGQGRPPLSSIIGIADDTYAPASGTVDPDGWMRADGTIVPPGYFLSGWTPPNLTNNRFLSGSTVANGTTGGTNSYALSVGQLPSHTHSISDSGHSHVLRYQNLKDGGGNSHNYYGPDEPIAGGTDVAVTGIAINNTGSGNAIDNRPAYLEVVFLVRVN